MPGQVPQLVPLPPQYELGGERVSPFSMLYSQPPFGCPHVDQPALHVMPHVPAEHDHVPSLVGHWWPQPPHANGSALRSWQAPLQLVFGNVQLEAHVPVSQTWFAWH